MSNPRADVTIAQRIDAAQHLAEARDGIGAAAHESPPEGRDPVQRREMGVVSGAGRAGSEQTDIGKVHLHLHRLAVACGIGDGGAASQDPRQHGTRW